MSRGDRSRPGRERTPEERERDRLERERKRALKAGNADPGAAADAVADDVAPAPPAEPEAGPVMSPEPEPEPEPATAPPAELEPRSPEPVEPQLGAEHFVAEPDPPTSREQPAHHELEPGAIPVDPEPWPVATDPPPAQPAVPADRAPSSAPTEALASAQPPAPDPLPPPAPAPAPAAGLPVPPPLPPRVAAQASPPPPPGAPAHRGRSILARLAAVAALAAVVVAVILVARSLGSKHTATVAAPTVIRVLIPEGKTRAQIAQIAAAEGLHGSYRAASRRSPLLDPRHYGAPAGTPDLEGFLFPATYDMDKGAAAAKLVDEQLVAFRENFDQRYVQRARALHLTPYELLIAASMVEREAKMAGDRPKVAAVIYNRLAQGIPLGVDATIYYAVELAKNVPTYTRELTHAQLHIDSPYNTRTHTGLPPTPISNPGIAAIHAAAYPAHVSYLYYVDGADGCGELVFSDTQSEFEADEAAYRAAVDKNGGRPPVCKHK